jgi:ABC-type phosphate/phosphonate transport system substrate-binding protein
MIIIVSMWIRELKTLAALNLITPKRIKYLNPVRRVVLVLALSLLFSQSLQADLILSAPPREPPAAGNKLYGPLADHLSELLGEKVIYHHPANWLEYQRDLRRGVYDIVFDGPHFVSWRMEHLHHDVLVKLPGSLEFVVAIAGEDHQIKSMNDLIGKRICALGPPNLATLTIMEQFPNPVRQPVIWDIPGGFMNVYKALKRDECRAAVFRSEFYDKRLSGKSRGGLKVIFRSRPLPNQAISAGPRLDKDEKAKILRSLTVGEGKNATLSISKRFAGNKSFIAATKEEYMAHNQLLEGVIYGW